MADQGEIHNGTGSVGGRGQISINNDLQCKRGDRESLLGVGRFGPAAGSEPGSQPDTRHSRRRWLPASREAAQFLDRRPTALVKGELVPLANRRFARRTRPGPHAAKAAEEPCGHSCGSSLVLLELLILMPITKIGSQRTSPPPSTHLFLFSFQIRAHSLLYANSFGRPHRGILVKTSLQTSCPARPSHPHPFNFHAFLLRCPWE